MRSFILVKVIDVSRSETYTSNRPSLNDACQRGFCRDNHYLMYFAVQIFILYLE